MKPLVVLFGIMRIVDWNIHRRLPPWDYVINELDADIALIQECSRLPETIDSSKVLHTLAKDRKFGNAIYVKDAVWEELPIETTRTGSLMVARVTTPKDESLVAISIYGLLEYLPENPSRKMVDPGIHKAPSDLAYLLEGLTRPKYTNFILAGDFNNDRRMDEHPTFKRKGKRTTNLMFDRVEDYLLQDCVKEYYPDYVQTYRHTTGGYPWQLDHMFASKKVFRNLKNLYVDNSDEVKNLSDHSPIVADFDI